jgi:methylated-DNA-[protein]-cysteine S-methyltransferase
MNTYYTTFATPLGRFSIAVDEAGSVVAAAFGGAAALAGRAVAGTLVGDPVRTGTARAQVEAYFAGRERTFDLPLAARGTPFQRRVWTALRAIPFGRTATYGEVAEAIGSRKAVRAVGGACGANPICVIVPCHRVIGADGSLTGFAFGEDTKRRLLRHEGFPAR